MGGASRYPSIGNRLGKEIGNLKENLRIYGDFQGDNQFKGIVKELRAELGTAIARYNKNNPDNKVRSVGNNVIRV